MFPTSNKKPRPAGRGQWMIHQRERAGELNDNTFGSAPYYGFSAVFSASPPNW